MPRRRGRAPGGRPTMTDVAKAAGVSQSTVSMVLNGVPGSRLAADTRQRVAAAAEQLGYQLPQRGRVEGLAGVNDAGPLSLAGPFTPSHERAAQRPLIGYLVDEISTSPHPVVSIDGARDAAWAQGCVLQVAVTRNNAEQQAAALDAWLGDPRLAGLIYSTIFTRGIEPPPALRRVPSVLLNCHDLGADAAQRLPCVVPGEVTGGHAATEYLLAQGHTRIGFINGEPWMEAAQDRLKGYRRALASADLPFDAALVRQGDWMSGTGFDGTLALMRLARPPTAIFCANDLMALGALEALKQLGLRVPQDVSVMGYDDQEISRHSHPPLTTLVLPNYEMGQAAVELLLARRRAGAPPSAATPATRRLVTKIDGPLVLRESVAPPPRRRSASRSPPSRP